MLEDIDKSLLDQSSSLWLTANCKPEEDDSVCSERRPNEAYDYGLDREGNRRLILDLVTSLMDLAQGKIIAHAIENWQEQYMQLLSKVKSPNLPAGCENVWLPALSESAVVERRKSSPRHLHSLEASSEPKPPFRVIVKYGYDLRQEAFIMQLIEFLHDIWKSAGINLYVRPYKIVPTSKDSGLVEFLEGTTPFHRILNASEGLSLKDYFQELFPQKSEYESACKAFTESVAGYWLIMYLIQIKGRHNGNTLLEIETGRVVFVGFKTCFWFFTQIGTFIPAWACG